jgi:hypothetical protein
MVTIELSEHIAGLIQMTLSVDLVRVVVNRHGDGCLTVYIEVRHLFSDELISLNINYIQVTDDKEILMDVIGLLEKVVQNKPV